MEALQMAQVLADLSSLQNTDATAANGLLTSNQAIAQKHSRRRSRGLLPEPAQFDKLGRRRLTTKNPSYNNGTRSPLPLGFHRMSSSLSQSTTGSGTATPDGNNAPGDADMARAKKLLELYEMRGKFKEMGDTGLARAKERVDKVTADYSQKPVK